MYRLDTKFTEQYLKTLLKFSKFLNQRAGELPRSRGSQLTVFLSNLQGDLTRNLKTISLGKSVNTEISIKPNIVFAYKNPKGSNRKFHVSIGGCIKIEGSTIVEQSLCVNLFLEHTKTCKKLPKDWQFYHVEEGFHVLRRFHFDYDSRNDGNSKPKFHLQYGGKFKEDYFDINNIHYKLFQPIDNPRLPQQPHDFIMLLDFMLREFSLTGNEITNEKRWNDCVIETEKLWLTPYYKEILTRLEHSSRNSPLHRSC